MKRLHGFVIFVLLLIVVGTGFSHPPAVVEAEFSVADHVITILVKHASRDQEAHFIDGITVVLNGKTVVEQTFFSQMGKGKQEASYILHDAKPGDEITIIATCNKYGEKKKKITVPSS